MQGGEVDIPKVTPGIQNVDRVEKAVLVLIDFGNHARSGVFPLLAFNVPAQMQFLAGLQLLAEAQHASIAADEEGLHGLRKSGALGCGPRRLDGHAEADTVALSEPIGECAHNMVRHSSEFQANTRENAA